MQREGRAGRAAAGARRHGGDAGACWNRRHQPACAGNDDCLYQPLSRQRPSLRRCAILAKETPMNAIIYLVGLIVVVMFILSFLGLR